MRFIPLLLMTALLCAAGSAQAMNLGLRAAMMSAVAKQTTGGGSSVTSWDAVTDSTAFTAIPGLPAADATLLAKAGVRASALAAWAKGVGGVSLGSAINLSAFLMNARNDVTSFEIDEELLAAVLSGDANAEVFKKRFPNAKVEIVEVNEGALKCTDNTKFYRLKLSVPTQE